MFRRNEGVADRATTWHCGKDGSFAMERGQILQTVDGDVCGAVEQCDLDRLREDAKAAHVAECSRLIAVAMRVDRL